MVLVSPGWFVSYVLLFKIRELEFLIKKAGVFGFNKLAFRVLNLEKFGFNSNLARWENVTFLPLKVLTLCENDTGELQFMNFMLAYEVSVGYLQGWVLHGI